MSKLGKALIKAVKEAEKKGLITLQHSTTLAKQNKKLITSGKKQLKNHKE